MQRQSGGEEASMYVFHLLFNIQAMHKLTLFFSSVFLFFSCLKEEIPVSKPLSNGVDVISVSMGSKYENQVFFSLSEQQIISQNNREIWDLAFETSENGFHVVLNGAKRMGAKLSTVTEFNEVNQISNDHWNWDVPSGNLDSTAIGDWRGNDTVILIDRGIGLDGLSLGFEKIKLSSVDANSYTIAFASLTETEIKTMQIPKNTAFDFIYFSFDEGGKIVHVAPEKEKWDLCFTAYTHIFAADHTPYSVTGVLTNPSGVKSYRLNKAFAQVTFADYLAVNLKTALNEIGYDWKTYNFDTSLYEVNSTICFLVENHEGRIFKIRFLDFYDANGVKGAPQFEFEELFP